MPSICSRQVVKLGNRVLLCPFSCCNIGYRLAVGLHDLEIVIVHPDASLKITLLAYDFLGGNVKDVAVQFVFLLLSHVEMLYSRNLVAGQHEGQAVSMSSKSSCVMEMARLQSRLRREHDVLALRRYR